MFVEVITRYHQKFTNLSLITQVSWVISKHGEHENPKSVTKMFGVNRVKN